MKLELISLWSHIHQRRHWQFSLILVLMIISSVAEIISIGAVIPFLGILTAPEQVFQYQMLQPMISFFHLTNPGQLILPITIIFIVSALVTGSIRVALLYVTTRFSYATGADIAVDVYRRTLYQNYEAHIAKNSSEIINSITMKTNMVVSGVLNPALIFISSLVLIVFIIFTLFFINPVVAFVSFSGFGFFYWIVILYTRKQLKENSECIAKESTQIIKSIQEGLGGIRDVIIDGSQELYISIYRNADQPLRRALGNNQFINGSPRYIMESLGMVLIAGIAYFMSLKEGGVSSVIPVLGALALGAQRMLPALQQLYGAYTNIKGSYVLLKDILTLLEQPLPKNITLSERGSISFEKNIRLKNISFHYAGTEKEIINGININIAKGSKIGLVGSTGSGKSTVIDVIMGLLSPTSGQIFIDNVKVDKSNQHLWRNHIAHVPQHIFLSDSTIEENIALGVSKDQINQNQVKEAASKAQLDKLIDSWPDKYQTMVGERGVRLSGGQRQRIGIARAIYKKAQVLIFDEATSALDNNTEREIVSQIERLKGEKTIIVVAHRYSTLQHCDTIYKLSNGKIINIGSYEDFIAISK